ncbi:MAG TPA: NAD(P)/FAD-dependent oxidoreductase [Chthoniobacteraceae bacterium]|nr:NAD(P)/FAD-dependent oxidoreductase [Chthoniobacteraceae bacterium]
MHDVIIIGAGPAGLSAALVLGRCRRKVLVFDSNQPRNSTSAAMHGFITRDGMHPSEFRAVAREQIRSYPAVEFHDTEVTKVERGEGQFTATAKDGRRFTARMLLLATGIVDEIPQIEGFHQFWGKSVHLCPYCDGWEHQDEPIAVYGRGIDGVEFALEMLGWTGELVLCTDGPADFPKDQFARLEAAKIPLIETPIARLEGEGAQITGVRFRDDTVYSCHALFFTAPQRQRSNLARELGCKFSEDGTTLDCKECASTNVPGVFVAGNTSRGLQLVIMAAADGTQAAFTINQALLEADCPKTDAEVGACAVPSTQSADDGAGEREPHIPACARESKVTAP